MAYADPQSITTTSGAISLPRTGSSLTSGTFTSGDRIYTLEISHQIGKRFRDMAKLTIRKIVSNPLVPSQNMTVVGSVHLVVDHPINGLSSEDVVDLAKALTTWLTASTSANTVKLIAGEA